MEKKLTSVGTILEWIDEKIKMINNHYKSPDDMPLSVRGQLNELINVRKVAAAHLPEEQKGFEEAYKTGWTECPARSKGKITEEHQMYFNDTYRQK